MTLDRLDIAERHLDRMNSFLPRIDAKVGFVAAWLSVELATAALNVRLLDLRTTYLWLPFLGYLSATFGAGLWLWWAVFPHTRGGARSLTYFGGIAAMSEPDFKRDYMVITESALLDDLSGQIWRNAEIVCDKYRAVQAAVRWASVSLLLLLTTLVINGYTHQSLPRLSGG